MEDIIQYIATASGWALFALVIITVIIHPQLAISLSSASLRLFRFMGNGVRKKYIAHDIQSNVMTAAKRVKEHNDMILPCEIRIEWVSEENRNAFISKGVVIVRMSDKKDPNKNIVWAIMQYVRAGMLPTIRGHFDKPLLHACDLAMTRKLISYTSTSALTAFNNEFINESKEPRLKIMYDNFVKLDNNGILTRVFLNELSKLENELDLTTSSNQLMLEISGFSNYLFTIANRALGEAIQRFFRGDYIRIATYFAISEDTKENITRAADQIRNIFDRGYDTVYILAIGYKVNAASDIADMIKDIYDNPHSIKHHEYTHVFANLKRRNAICIEIDTSI